VQDVFDCQLTFEVAQSREVALLKCLGRGVEPQISFDQSIVDFPPTIPYFAAERSIVVCNPCNFPVEFYSVDFDEVYIEEEKVSTK
jgi:hydrocephalus-inducing protein